MQNLTFRHYLKNAKFLNFDPKTINFDPKTLNFDTKNLKFRHHASVTGPAEQHPYQMLNHTISPWIYLSGK